MSTRSTPVTDGFLTVRQFAEELGVRPATVRGWVMAGSLQSIRLGRLILIPRDALRRALEQGK